DARLQGHRATAAGLALRSPSRPVSTQPRPKSVIPHGNLNVAEGSPLSLLLHKTSNCQAVEMVRNIAKIRVSYDPGARHHTLSPRTDIFRSRQEAYMISGFPSAYVRSWRSGS